MSEFKFIYWWEWGHRQLGRFIGLVWALGFAFFFLTKKIPQVAHQIAATGGLGGLQGALVGGWYTADWVVRCWMSPRTVWRHTLVWPLSSWVHHLVCSANFKQ